MRTTLRDIAQELNLSTAIVSRVLNHKPGSWASPETQQRIFETAQNLNYRPSAFARALSTGRTMQIAAIASPRAMKGGQFLDLEGVAERAGEHRYRVLVLPLGDGAAGEAMLEDLITDRVCDGLCLYAPQVTEGHLRIVARHEIPCVVIGSLFDKELAEQADGCAVVVDHDNYRAAYDSVAWLAKEGRTRIAWVKAPGETDQPHALELRRGYCDSMRDAKLEPHVLEHFEEHAALLKHLEKRRFDAVIVRYMHGAMGWMLGAREVGLKTARDLTIMAHLEAHDVMNFALCGAASNLAVHVFDAREAGACAAETLIRWAMGTPPEKRTFLVLPHTPFWGKDI